MPDRRRILAAAAGSAALAVTGGARPAAARRAWPRTLPLPTGFQPEGIAIGSGPHAYVTSLATGDVYRLDLATGAGRTLTPGSGAYSAGIESDTYGRLFVAGAGTLTVIHAASGTVLRRYPIAGAGAFLNDVLVTGHAVYVTDSALPVLYRLPLGRGGALPPPTHLARIPLGGDIAYHDGWNVSGIEQTPDRAALLLAQSNTGQVHRVDPASGIGVPVRLAGATLPGADGLLRTGRTLYVVQARSNTLAVLRLDSSGTSGRVVDRRTDSRFDIPTSVARHAGRLYLPNARVGVEDPGNARYTVVALPR